MNKEFTTKNYLDAFKHSNIGQHYIKMLLAHYFSPNKTITATQMAHAMGYKNFNASNLHYGRLARVIGNSLGWEPIPQTALYVLAEFEKPAQEWFWIMRPEVAQAIEQLGLIEAAQAIIPEEINEKEQYFEGSTHSITVNVYERNPVAREKCILYYGCKCYFCGITLADIYGEIAQGHIHVHHLKQLSDISMEYQIDPINDLRPVCPNCHVIMHLKNPPYSIDEMKSLIENQKAKSASMR
jgi:5-methylcytosine-specific restriction protein A